MTRLIIHAWFPHLAAERVRRTSDVSPMHPLVLTRAVHGAELVDSVCVLARRLGLRGGMRLADARALRPDLLSHPADDAADRQDLQHLAMWARRYCPLTAPAPAGITGGGASIAHDGNGIWLDVAGATHLHGGIRPLLADMARRLRRAGLTIRLAVAPTCGAAWGLARYAPAAQRYGCSRHSASSSRQLSAMLAGLPLAALRLDGTVCTAMAASGLRHVGDLLGMARAPLASRFGQVVTHQLDAALGHVNESFTPLMPARPRVAMRQFAEPVAAPEDIQVIASGLAGEMVDILQQQGLATRRLQLGWQRVDNMVMGRDVHFSRPSRDSGAFCRLLVSAAETIDPEFGLERMWLEAHDCSPQAPVAARFDEGISASETYASLVDRLVARLGYGAVLHMRARNCWQPEAAQYAAYADMETAGFHDDMNTTPHCLTAAPRPIRLLGVPQKLAVVALLPDHPPARFVWQKRTHKVIRASGPERIAPQWWSAAAGTRTRDYFRLQDEDGARFWVYREGLPERGEEPDWFLPRLFCVMGGTASDTGGQGRLPPAQTPGHGSDQGSGQGSGQPSALLGCYSNFTFLAGASHPAEMIETAAALGWQAIGVADVNSLAGIVRAHSAARDAGIRLVVGSRLRPVDGPDVIAHPVDRAGYEALSVLLSEANMRGSKAAPVLYLADLARLTAGTMLLVMPPRHPDAAHATQLGRIRDMTAARVFAGAVLYRDGGDEVRLAMLADMAKSQQLPLTAAGDALYHSPTRRPLADVLACIREGQRLDSAGALLSRNAERQVLAPDEMARRWRHWPDALANADALAAACHFAMDDLSYEYPAEVAPGGRNAMDELEYQTWNGARERYPDGIPEKVESYLQRELLLIAKLKFAPYFLTVFDIVRFARSRGILCQGRGSAANSAVCYCLGITSVDPDRSQPLFERFISEARGEPPDIDVDFEHERREEVIQHIYAKYGRTRAGLTAAVITYRSRSALREVAKVFGLSSDVQAALSGQTWGREGGGPDDAALRAVGIDPVDRRIALVRRLVTDISRFPRHLSQHVGGFVITRGRLDHLCPISPAAMEGRTVIEWDKDDLDALGLLKVDVLALGMLSCIRRAFGLLVQHYKRPLTLASVPPEDTATYDMLCAGKSVGVFQVESRAQMAMLPRLQPRCFHDLVVQVAIVRPGPIQGDMVHPYLRRRAGLEKVSYPSDALRNVLDRTLGVPLFQEQAMQIAIVGAGFTGSEADQLRRAMATFKKHGDVSKFHDKMIRGMVTRGYDADFAERCFRQIEGFGTYGFPESHAASFALLVYVSAWIKCHYPDVFICALLNAQPMGFYSSSQLVAEAKRSGITVRPTDVMYSDWDSTLEADPANRDGRHALRLGLRLVKGLSETEGTRIAASRADTNYAETGAGYTSPADIMRRADVSAKALEAIARADGFNSLGLNRRKALWEVRALARQRWHELPLFAHATRRHDDLAGDEPAVTLPAARAGEEVAADYRSLGLSLKAHPVTLLAEPLAAAGWKTSAAAFDARDGQRLRLAGLVTMRQRPGTAKGTVFLTLEDGLQSLNVIIWPKLTETYRDAMLQSQILGVVGRIQREKAVLHFIADALFNLNGFLGHLDAESGRDHRTTRMRSRDFR